MYSNLEAIDFGKLYTIQKKASSFKKKDKSSWDKKACEMNKKIHNGFYNDFIEEIIPFNSKDTLLDVGCGPGTFSLRFAPFFKHIYAFDFSSEMIKFLEEKKKEEGIENLNSFISNMEESWEDIPVCDIVLASRCLEVDNIELILKELNSHAKKAVYLTYKVGKSYLDERVLQAIDRKIVPKPDYMYLLNVLYGMGINAEVRLISSKDSKCTKVISEEEYLESISWSLDGINEEEKRKAKLFYKKCLKNNDEPPLRDNRWALISWNKSL